MHEHPFILASESEAATAWYEAGSPYGQEEYDTFYRALGESLATWALVEFRLFAILAKSISSSQSHAVAEMFFSTDGFRPKLRMTDAALRHSNEIKLKIDEWDCLKKQVSNASSARNDIAHQAVFFDPSCPKNRRFFLSKGGANGIKSRKHLAELNHLQGQFKEASDKLFQFWLSL